ncbi:MAG TPA: ABC transporter permease [Candidatus Bathyarchaeia archaeon]|nr:ABC transporter permease [Candidatus Bathyarchaeia archaeon]
MTATVQTQRSQRRRGVSQWALAWRRLRKNKAAIAGLAIVSIIGVMAVFEQLVAIYPPHCLVGESPFGPCPKPTPYKPNAAPSLAHPLGADYQGRDVYSEIVYGARPAFYVGLGATAITMLLAVLVGMVAGYFGGWIDNVLMRMTEVFLVIPFFLVLLVFLKVLFTFSSTATSGLGIVIVIIGVFSWAGAARIIRAEVLRTREFEYIAASKQLGASGFRILFRHLFPNVLHIIMVLATLQIATSILTEAAVSFLGFGDTNLNTWGQQLANASSAVKEAWWAGLFPGIFVTLLVMGFNLLGNGLRDALDPRLRE